MSDVDLTECLDVFLCLANPGKSWEESEAQGRAQWKDYPVPASWAAVSSYVRRSVKSPGDWPAYSGVWFGFRPLAGTARR